MVPAVDAHLGNVVFNKPLLQQLYRYCYALAGCPDAAYDLLHDGIERYLTACSEDTVVNVAYLRRIIRNRQNDLWRRDQVLRTQPFDESDGTVASDPISLDERALEATQIDAELDVQTLLRELEPRDREILYYWAYEGYSTSEISEVLSMPRGTVLSRMHRLKRRLAKHGEPAVNSETGTR